MEHMGLTGKAQDARLRIQLEVGEVMVVVVGGVEAFIEMKSSYRT